MIKYLKKRTDFCYHKCDWATPHFGIFTDDWELSFTFLCFTVYFRFGGDKK